MRVRRRGRVVGWKWGEWGRCRGTPGAAEMCGGKVSVCWHLKNQNKSIIEGHIKPIFRAKAYFIKLIQNFEFSLQCSPLYQSLHGGPQRPHYSHWLWKWRGWGDRVDNGRGGCTREMQSHCLWFHWRNGSTTAGDGGVCCQTFTV